MNNRKISGEELFWRFVRLDIGALQNEVKSVEDLVGQYDELARSAFVAEPDPNTLILFRKRTRDLASSAVIEYATSQGLFGAEYLYKHWPRKEVGGYWYFKHRGHRRDFAKVIRKFHVPGTYMCESNLDRLMAVDPYGLLEEGSASGVDVVIYRSVICDILDREIVPTDVPLTGQVDLSAIYVHRAPVGDILGSFRGKPVWLDPL